MNLQECGISTTRKLSISKRSSCLLLLWFAVDNILFVMLLNFDSKNVLMVAYVNYK
jgi:hypothetical protein